MGHAAPAAGRRGLTTRVGPLQPLWVFHGSPQEERFRLCVEGLERRVRAHGLHEKQGESRGPRVRRALAVVQSAGLAPDCEGPHQRIHVQVPEQLSVPLHASAGRRFDGAYPPVRRRHHPERGHRGRPRHVQSCRGCSSVGRRNLGDDPSPHRRRWLARPDESAPLSGPVRLSGGAGLDDSRCLPRTARPPSGSLSGLCTESAGHGLQSGRRDAGRRRGDSTQEWPIHSGLSPRRGGRPETLWAPEARSGVRV